MTPCNLGSDYPRAEEQHSHKAGAIDWRTRPVRSSGIAPSLSFGWSPPMTAGRIALTRNQIAVSSLTYLIAAFVIYIAAEQLNRSMVSQWQLKLWVCAALITWASRHAAYAFVLKFAPVTSPQSPRFRAVLVIAIVISAVFWFWSAQVLILRPVTAMVVVFILCYVLLSIAMIGMWHAAPIGSGIFILALWGGLTLRFLHTSALSSHTILEMDISVFVLLWLCFCVSINQIEPLLKRNDVVDNLVVALQAANAKLERMGVAAKTDLDRRVTFYSQASHDFRQRLYSMKLIAYSAAQNAQTGESAKRTIVRLTQDIESLSSYVSKIMDFARIEELGTQLNLQRVRVQDVFQSLDLQFEPTCKPRMSIMFRPTNIELLTDKTLLCRILENLVANAIKFSRRKILVCARRNRGGFSIEVRDQGAGISQDETKHIFEAFYQIDREDERCRDGIGLGLSIVQRFTSALGYAIVIKSVPGSGTLFRIQIPASTQRAATLPNA